MSQAREAKRSVERSVPVAATQLAGASVWESKLILPVLLVLFVGSGCAGLMYEIVWFQLLRLVIGSSAVSIAVLLGTFMGGMCLGSLVLPRMISDRHHPLRVYGVLEIGIGILGLLLFFLIPMIGNFYTGFSGHGWGSILLRGLISVICLLPPTMLMGATLPAIARWVETTPQGVSRLGFFYGANIAGAVFGCLFAGFVLLRTTDSWITTLVAVGINLIVGGLGIALSLTTSQKVVDDAAPENPVPEKAPHAWTIYITIALSGLTAVGAEVVWTRLLSLLLGATTYTFSIILAVFLIGLGIGSSAGAAISKRMKSPRMGLAICQASLAAAIAWGSYMICESLPWWPIDPGLSVSSWSSFQLDFLRCLWAMLPASILWGASFPLALASVAAREQDPGRLVGGVYAANTLGAIAGALGFGMIVIGAEGTQNAQLIMVWLTVGSAALVLAPLVVSAVAEVLAIKHAPDGEVLRWRNNPDRFLTNLGVICVAPLAVAVAAFSCQFVATPPPGLIAYGRTLAFEATETLPEFIYVGEGMNASIAVSEYPGAERNFHVSGKVVASSTAADMRLQHMLGHIPALLHPNPKKVLIVGCGAGVTAGTFALYPDIEEIVLCEIEPLIPKAAERYFSSENNFIMDDKRLRIIDDDARHFIATTDEKFDIITSDPIHPWVKGAAALYSTEYHALCKERLAPDGIITLWVPLYESNEAAVKSEFASFFQVFDDGTVWHNDKKREGYDAVAMSGIGHVDLDLLQARIDHFRPIFLDQMRKHGIRGRDLNRLDPFAVINRVSETLPNQRWDLESRIFDLPNYDAFGIAATFVGHSNDLQDWLRDAEINTDLNMRLQYLAGEGFNELAGDDIFRAMTRNRTFPSDFFSSDDPEAVELLKDLYFEQASRSP